MTTVQRHLLGLLDVTAIGIPLLGVISFLSPLRLFWDRLKLLPNILGLLNVPGALFLIIGLIQIVWWSNLFSPYRRIMDGFITGVAFEIAALALYAAVLPEILEDNWHGVGQGGLILLYPAFAAFLLAVGFVLLLLGRIGASRRR